MSEITVTISGPVGCGKSAIAGEIEIALKAIGVPVRYADKKAARSEKNMTGADWTSYLEMYQPNVVLVEQIATAESSLRTRAETAERLLQEMTEYALDATKALTGLSGGGSEMFSGRIGNIFKADIEKCVQVVRDRYDNSHQFMVKAVKEKNAAVERSEVMAKALEKTALHLTEYIMTIGKYETPRSRKLLDEINAVLDAYRNREGNGNDKS